MGFKDFTAANVAAELVKKELDKSKVIPPLFGIGVAAGNKVALRFSRKLTKPEQETLDGILSTVLKVKTEELDNFCQTAIITEAIFDSGLTR